MNCEKCKDQDECDIYQDWLNTRDCCCPIRQELRKEEEKCNNCGYKTTIISLRKLWGDLL